MTNNGQITKQDLAIIATKKMKKAKNKLKLSAYKVGHTVACECTQLFLLCKLERLANIYLCSTLDRPRENLQLYRIDLGS